MLCGAAGERFHSFFQFSQTFTSVSMKQLDHEQDFYLNNRVFLSRNYRLIVAPRKFDVLKTNICPRSEASRANMLDLGTSDFQGAAIKLIVPRHKHSIVFIAHPLNFPVAACLKTGNDKNLFIKISNRYGTLRCFVFSAVSSSDDITSIHVYTITKSIHAFRLVNQLWFIVPVNPWKNCASSELLYKSNRLQVSMVYRLINHAGCW